MSGHKAWDMPCDSPRLGCRDKDGFPRTDLIMIQVIQTLKGEVFLLNLLHYFLREFPELAQRTHGLPPTQVRNKTVNPSCKACNKLPSLWFPRD